MATDPLIYAITRSKNEADVIEGSIRRLLREVDHIIIGDGSDPGEGTREVLEGFVNERLPITLVDDRRLNWHQREVMTDYAGMARRDGAEWVLCTDVDEAWYVPGHTIRETLAVVPPAVMVVKARNFTYSATARDDPADPDPMSRMRWRAPDPSPLPKVACRTREDLVIGHGNHSANYAETAESVWSAIRCAHYPYRTPEQFIKRVRGAWPSIRDSGLPESHGAHMWAYGRALDEGGEDALRSWFADGMWFEDPAGSGLVYDPAPALRSGGVAG